MTMYRSPFYTIFFGDSSQSVSRDFLLLPSPHAELMKIPQLFTIAQSLNLKQLALLTQTHSAFGAMVPRDYSPQSSERPEGDYLITQQPQIGLGVYTADCLPIIFIDEENHAIGIAHAGWAGTLKQVATTTLRAMEKEFGTQIDRVVIVFGPSALRCCYEVQEDFRERLGGSSFESHVLIKRDGRLFFDLPLYNRLALSTYGVPSSSFVTTDNVCTICNPTYCSNRRNRESAQRQLTVVTIN